MSEPISSGLEELNKLDVLCRWFPEIAGDWEMHFVRRVGPDCIGADHIGSEDLLWSFSLAASDDRPRGYVDSIRQRCALWAAVEGGVPRISSANLSKEGEIVLVSDSSEGEPFPIFCRRTAWRRDSAFLALLLDMVQCLSELANFPRLLSCITADDFFVFRRSGVHLEAEFSPAFSMLRGEAPKSDFQIAQYWVSSIAAFVVAAEDGWRKEFGKYDPLDTKLFRSFIKKLDRGDEKSLGECFSELENVLLLELASKRTRAETQRFVWGNPNVPKGALHLCLIDALKASFPDKVPPGSEEMNRVQFSPFVIPIPVDSPAEDSLPCRAITLLPPEKWFEFSLIEPVNRKLSTPFLKQHPNITRVRSILCEEGFTALVGDAGGIPLPSLLEVRQGLSNQEILMVVAKLDRALTQFESAEFFVEIHSPWQIEIHPVDPGRQGDFYERWIATPMGEWPAWDIKIRAERPPESFLPSQTGGGWRRVFSLLLTKSFPALFIWMLDWKRFEWAARKGTLDREPLSWDKNMNALFEATIEHFEPNNSTHRARFLELVEEGIESDRNL